MLSWDYRRKCFKEEGRRDLLCHCSWGSIKMRLEKRPLKSTTQSTRVTFIIAVSVEWWG